MYSVVLLMAMTGPRTRLPSGTSTGATAAARAAMAATAARLLWLPGGCYGLLRLPRRTTRHKKRSHGCCGCTGCYGLLMAARGVHGCYGLHGRAGYHGCMRLLRDADGATPAAHDRPAPPKGAMLRRPGDDRRQPAGRRHAEGGRQRHPGHFRDADVRHSGPSDRPELPLHADGRGRPRRPDADHQPAGHRPGRLTSRVELPATAFGTAVAAEVTRQRSPAG